MFKVGDKVYAYDRCRGSFRMDRDQGVVVEIKKKIVAHTIVETYLVQWESQGKKISDRFFYKHEIYRYTDRDMQIGDLVTLSLNGKSELCFFNEDKERKEYGFGVVMKIDMPHIHVHWLTKQQTVKMWYLYIKLSNPEQ